MMLYSPTARMVRKNCSMRATHCSKAEMIAKDTMASLVLLIFILTHGLTAGFQDMLMMLGRSFSQRKLASKQFSDKQATKLGIDQSTLLALAEKGMLDAKEFRLNYVQEFQKLERELGAERARERISNRGLHFLSHNLEGLELYGVF